MQQRVRSGAGPAPAGSQRDHVSEVEVDVRKHRERLVRRLHIVECDPLAEIRRRAQHLRNRLAVVRQHEIGQVRMRYIDLVGLLGVLVVDAGHPVEPVARVR